MLALKTYLKRIGYSGQPQADLETLRHLHERHIQAIPFENLNPWLGWPVEIDAESLQNKLIDQKRGGYCFEQNGLFKLALEAVGFKVRPLAGRVLWGQDEGNITPRTHMLLLVHLEGRQYISDVGFGGQTPTAPLLLEPDIVQETPHEPYKLVLKQGNYFLKTAIGGEWRTMYRFTADAVPPVDYKLANWYTSTHPSSHFVSGLTVARIDRGCRYVLSNNRFAIHRTNQPSERRLLSTTVELKSVLENVMKLILPVSSSLDARLQEIIHL